MRKVVVFIMIFVMSGMFITLSADAAEPTFSADKERAFGFKIMGGGRYDDLRMCVGSPAGVKGGPVGDIKLFMKFRMSLDWSMTVTIPVFRPILFGAGFKMLQYESDVAMEYKIKMSPKTDFVTGPGIGLSYHYGPDYNSESSGDKRTDSFLRHREMPRAKRSCWAILPALPPPCAEVFPSGTRRRSAACDMAAGYFSRLRRWALNLLKKDQTRKEDPPVSEDLRDKMPPA